MKNLGYKVVAALTAAALPALAFAAPTEVTSSADVPMLVFTKFAEIVSRLINYYLMFAGLIWVVFILIH
jgi:hypothetical protein